MTGFGIWINLLSVGLVPDASTWFGEIVVAEGTCALVILFPDFVLCYVGDSLCGLWVDAPRGVYGCLIRGGRLCGLFALRVWF